MGFGVGCYANCCQTPAFQVITARHDARADDVRSVHNEDPAGQWRSARGSAWNIYSNGVTITSPGPCNVILPIPNPPPPLGWRQTSAMTSQIINLGNGQSEEVISGAGEVFGYYGSTIHDGPPPNDTVWFAKRRILGHARIGAGGVFYGGQVTPAGTVDTAIASASMQNSVWIFIVPSAEGQSLQSQWGYNGLEFRLRLNQFSEIGMPLDLPPSIIEYAEWHSNRRTYDPITTKRVDTGEFSMIAGNVAGVVPDFFSAGQISDPTSAFYWAMTHILLGDYAYITNLPSPPRDASIVQLRMDTTSSGTNFSGYLNTQTDQGLNTSTPITNQIERLYLSSGSAWFLAIVPTKMCMDDVLPQDLPRIRNDGTFDSWFTQLWVGNKLSSMNIVRLTGYSGTGSHTLVPWNPVIPNTPPRL